jgi:hypothetical protein
LRSGSWVTFIVLRITQLVHHGICYTNKNKSRAMKIADPSDRAVWGVGLRPSACWDRGFESHPGHGCLTCTVLVSGRGLCDGPIPLPEESYRMWCVLEYDQVTNQKPTTTYCEQVGRRGRTTKYNKNNETQFFECDSSVYGSVLWD